MHRISLRRNCRKKENVIEMKKIRMNKSKDGSERETNRQAEHQRDIQADRLAYRKRDIQTEEIKDIMHDSGGERYEHSVIVNVIEKRRKQELKSERKESIGKEGREI